MKRMSTRELRELEVVNLCTGEKLGYPCDFEFDLDDGRILALIVQMSDGLPIFGKKQDCIIEWCKIECIGEDTILVRLDRCDIPHFDKPKKGKRKC